MNAPFKLIASKNIYVLLMFLAILFSLTQISFGQIIGKESITLKIFGGEKRDVGGSIGYNEEGRFLIVGSTRSFGSGKDDIWLISLNNDTDTLWTRTLGTTNTERTGTNSVVSLDGQGWVIGGTQYVDDSLGYNILLVEIDSLGNEIWTKNIGGEGLDQLESIQKTNDQGFLLSGGTTLDSREVPWLLKTDSKGDTLWTRKYPGNGNGHIEAAIQISDGGYFAVGSTDDNWSDSVSYPMDLVARKLDNKGVLQWDWRYGGKEIHVWPEWVLETKEEYYLIVGAICQPCSPKLRNYQENFDVFVALLNSDGTSLWTRTIGGDRNDLGYFVTPTTSDSFIIGGSTSSHEGPGDSPWLVEIDLEGLVIWSKILPSPFPRNGVAQVFEYDTNKFLITGPPFLYQRGGEQDIWIMLLDRN